MAGMKGMYQGPKVVPWSEVEKQYEWFKVYQHEIAKHGMAPGHRLAFSELHQGMSRKRLVN